MAQLTIDIKKGSWKTSKTLEFIMEAAAGFEPENNCFAGRFLTNTSIYLQITSSTFLLYFK
jgi:hypothetical protein